MKPKRTAEKSARITFQVPEDVVEMLELAEKALELKRGYLVSESILLHLLEKQGRVIPVNFSRG